MKSKTAKSSNNSPPFVESDGRRFIRVRDRSIVDGASGIYNDPLYVEVDAAGIINRNRLFYPALRPEGSTAPWVMHDMPWLSRHVFEIRGLPAYDLPAEPVTWPPKTIRSRKR